MAVPAGATRTRRHMVSDRLPYAQGQGNRGPTSNHARQL